MSNTTRKFTLVVTGNTDTAYEDALAEALDRIRAGNLSGTDRNEDGAFYFDSTDDVPAGEQPMIFAIVITQISDRSRVDAHSTLERFTMLKALRYEILRNVTASCRLSMPLAEKPIRVATLLNESLFLEDQVMTHLRSVFLEDRTHDWDWSDASGEGRFRYFSRIADAADVIVVYEIDDKYMPPPAPHKFCMKTGQPLMSNSSPTATPKG